MRRLLFYAAFAAGMLVAPSAALAAGPIAITTPAAETSYTTTLPITIVWTDTSLDVTYDVFRGSPDCSSATDISGPIDGLASTSPFSYTDNAALPEDTYCYFVQATDALLGTLDSSQVRVTYDKTAPVITGVTTTGGDGCTAAFIVAGATATDASPVTFTTDGLAALPFTPTGAPYSQVTVNVIGTDAAGNVSAPFPVTGRIDVDPAGMPGPPTLEVTSDPDQRRATLSWDPVSSDGAPVSYSLTERGPNGSTTTNNLASPVVEPNLQVDATYEFTLNAVDACGKSGGTSVRLVRLDDTTPPSAPIIAGPSFNPATHAVTLSWVPSDDNIQIDHYDVLRDGVPLGATDATTFVDVAPTQHASLTYVVIAVDTNGNETDSAPAVILTPDWTPPSAPVPIATVDGTTVKLHWKAAVDNVGVVSYVVFRDDKFIGSTTAAVPSYTDLNVKPGLHTWTVQSVDDAQLTATSGPITETIKKPVALAKVLKLQMTGNGGGKRAARYALTGPARLLVDIRVVGTLAHAKLHLHLKSGNGRITVWRGTPGSSAPRLRLGSSLTHAGLVTVRLNRTLHAGHIRLVLVAGGHVVILTSGKNKPSVRAG
jgi:hypothetical protein